MFFDDRDGRGFGRRSLGLGGDIEAVELAIELEAAGGAVGQVVSQHVEGFHARAEAAGGGDSEGVHGMASGNGGVQMGDRNGRRKKTLQNQGGSADKWIRRSL